MGPAVSPRFRILKSWNEGQFATFLSRNRFANYYYKLIHRFRNPARHLNRNRLENKSSVEKNFSFRNYLLKKVFFQIHFYMKVIVCAFFGNSSNIWTLSHSTLQMGDFEPKVTMNKSNKSNTMKNADFLHQAGWRFRGKRKGVFRSHEGLKV